MNFIYMNTYRAPRREIGYKHFTMVAIALFSVSEHTHYALLYMSLNEWLWLYTAHWFGHKNNIAQFDIVSDVLYNCFKLGVRGF